MIQDLFIRLHGSFSVNACELNEAQLQDKLSFLRWFKNLNSTYNFTGGLKFIPDRTKVKLWEKCKQRNLLKSSNLWLFSDVDCPFLSSSFFNLVQYGFSPVCDLINAKFVSKFIYLRGYVKLLRSNNNEKPIIRFSIAHAAALFDIYLNVFSSPSAEWPVFVQIPLDLALS